MVNGANPLGHSELVLGHGGRAPGCQPALVANPINRYSLGDRYGMTTALAGTLTNYLQHDSPGADKQSNWLPAPESELFLMPRPDLPDEELVKQECQPPAIKRIQ